MEEWMNGMVKLRMEGARFFGIHMRAGSGIDK